MTLQTEILSTETYFFLKPIMFFKLFNSVLYGLIRFWHFNGVQQDVDKVSRFCIMAILVALACIIHMDTQILVWLECDLSFAGV